MNKKIWLILSVAAVSLLVGCCPPRAMCIAEVFNSKTKLPNPNIEQSDKINGTVPPNKPTKTISEERLITEEILDPTGKPTGWVLITNRSVREQGTRTPIHVHPYGGQTCVLAGEMSLYLDKEPTILKTGAGKCYYMPAGRRMSAVNSGNTDAILFDTFVMPKDERIWIVVEPGLQDQQDQFDTLWDHKKH